MLERIVGPHVLAVEGVHLLGADLLLDVMDPAALQRVRLPPRRAVPAGVGLPHRSGALPPRVVVHRELDRRGECLAPRRLVPRHAAHADDPVGGLADEGAAQPCHGLGPHGHQVGIVDRLERRRSVGVGGGVGVGRRTRLECRLECRRRRRRRPCGVGGLALSLRARRRSRRSWRGRRERHRLRRRRRRTRVWLAHGPQLGEARVEKRAEARDGRGVVGHGVPCRVGLLLRRGELRLHGVALRHVLLGGVEEVQVGTRVGTARARAPGRRLDGREAHEPARGDDRREAAALAEAKHAVVRAAAHEVGQRGADAVEACLPRLVVRHARLAPPLVRAHLVRISVQDQDQG